MNTESFGEDEVRRELDAVAEPADARQLVNELSRNATSRATSQKPCGAF